MQNNADTITLRFSLLRHSLWPSLANPEDPQSALNAIPKAILQGARGTCLSYLLL